LKNIIAFIKFEKSHGRQKEIECQDENILQVVKDVVSRPDTVENILLPTENAFIYHATDLEAAQKILSCGKLLSAEKVYGKTGEELSFVNVTAFGMIQQIFLNISCFVGAKT
jgi:hypothetical protein